MRHPENQNSTKNVSFYDVSENSETSSSEISSIYRSMPVRSMSSRSCSDKDRLTRGLKRNIECHAIKNQSKLKLQVRILCLLLAAVETV